MKWVWRLTSSFVKNMSYQERTVMVYYPGEIFGYIGCIGGFNNKEIKQVAVSAYLAMVRVVFPPDYVKNLEAKQLGRKRFKVQPLSSLSPGTGWLKYDKDKEEMRILNEEGNWEPCQTAAEETISKLINWAEEDKRKSILELKMWQANLFGLLGRGRSALVAITQPDKVLFLPIMRSFSADKAKIVNNRAEWIRYLAAYLNKDSDCLEIPSIVYEEINRTKTVSKSSLG